MTTGNTATAAVAIALAVLLGATAFVAPAMAGDGKSATESLTPYVDVEAARAVIDAGPIDITATPIDPISRGVATQNLPWEIIAVRTEAAESVSAAAVSLSASSTELDDRLFIVGNSMTGFVNGGWWTEYYAPDGTIKGVWRGSRYFAKWSVDGEMMCFEKTARGSSCLLFTVDGEKASFYRQDGTGGTREFKLLKGNPKNL